MNPNISLGSWAFAFGPFERSPWPFSKVIRYAANAGYQGVEINGFDPHPNPDNCDTPRKRNDLKQDIAALGLGVSGFAPDFRSAPPAVAEESAYLELLKKYIHFAQELGTHTLRVDTVGPPEPLSGREYGARFSRLASTWQAAGELARREGVRIVWEFEPGFWLNKPSEVKRLMEEINHPHVQVLFDTSHAYTSGVVGARHVGDRETLPGGVVEYAKLLESRIGHLHLIDSDGTLHDEETSVHRGFGQGVIDFAAFLSACQATVRHLEWWCVDFCFNAEAERLGKQAIPFIRACIREAWRE